MTPSPPPTMRPTPTDLQIRLERVFDAPREMVWQAWVDHAHLARWFFPGEAEAIFVESDGVEKGRYRVGMRVDDGTEHIATGEYLQLEKPSLLVMTHGWENLSSDGPAVGPMTTLRVQLDEVDGKTRMIFQQWGFSSVESRDGHRDGWSGAFDNLAGHFPEFTDVEENTLVVSRRFEAPLDLVYEVYTQPEHVKHWSAPDHYTLLEIDEDIRVGGKYRCGIRGPNDQEFWMTGEYLEVFPKQRLKCTFQVENKTETLSPVMVVTVTFTHHEGKTTLTLHQAPFKTAQDRDAHQQGMQTCFDKLEQRLAQSLA